MSGETKDKFNYLLLKQEDDGAVVILGEGNHGCPSELDDLWIGLVRRLNLQSLVVSRYFRNFYLIELLFNSGYKTEYPVTDCVVKDPVEGLAHLKEILQEIERVAYNNLKRVQH